MILVIGGSHQGKLAFAMELATASNTDVANGETGNFTEFAGKKIVNHLHALVGRCLQEKRDIEPLIQDIIKQMPDVIFICDEVGSGIVPADPYDRAWREETGRLCCRLAKEAEQVIRICCGLPTMIKEKPKC